MDMDSRTDATPARNQEDGHWPNSGIAPTTVSTTLSALAKFFRMLSAYLTTRPTMRPPKT
jgi:hypothetical protein